MHTRTPITDDGIAAHHAATLARMASGEFNPADPFGGHTPYASAIVRDPKETMVQLFLENPQITYDEMREHLDDRQIERWTPEARREANRRSERRAA